MWFAANRAVAPFEIDHIHSRALGGASQFDSWAYACPHCIAHKWKHVTGIDPLDGSNVPLFNPREQTWSDHFRYTSPDMASIEGVTACGRATVGRLKMNAPEMVVIRRLLAKLE